ncbi:MAG: DEAD/DEAH box helicase, partial [Spirochaetia bacterium]|nr:DEAD/DEAH box helicase [Spirochaetia bacterium]
MSKSIVIAATGTGKTYLAAFDFRKSKFDRILFIAHRINILESSKKAITSVMGSNFNSVIISGNSSQIDRLPKNNISGVFAMVQTFHKQETLSNYPRDYFDYIVIDEFHHAKADSYKSILEYFTPKFLLGLTATPERMDGRDVFELCDNNIAFEIRLFTAIEKNLLVPFYYYAIYDEINYEAIKWNGTDYNQKELEILLSNDTRSKLVLKNLNKYLPSGNGKTKALGFCASKIHAQYMKSSFIKLGKSAEVVLGETTESERIQILQRLSNDNDDLEVVFSVDVFTEGVDIPDLTHILLLRPTQSFTVFQQQIGRGLRLHPSKEFVIILDFIGNYKNNFIPYLTLRGMSSANTINIKKLQDNPSPPSNCFIDENTEVVQIQKKRIYQLFKPGNVEYLKNIYAEVKEDYEKISENSKIDHPLL